MARKDKLAAAAADSTPEEEHLDGAAPEAADEEKPPVVNKASAPAKPAAAKDGSENFRVVNHEGNVVKSWPFGYDNSSMEQKQEVINYFKNSFLSGWQLLPEDPRVTFDRRKEEAKKKRREEVLT